jgi:hypothetical protein
MKRFLAILLVLAAAPAAHASWTLDLPTGLSKGTVGPVFAGDGSIVFGAMGEKGLSLWRVTGDGAAAQPLVTLASSTDATTTLFAVGRGFGYQEGYARGTRLVVQPDFAKPAVTVADAPAYASRTCPRLPGHVAADAGAILVIPTCDDSTEIATPWIYDVATGAITALGDVPWDAEPQVAGDFASGRGPYELSEIDWRTGRVVRDRLPIDFADILLDDGSIVRRTQDRTVRSAPDGTETPLPIEGYWIATAGEGFRTFLDGYGDVPGDYDDRDLRLWSRDGQLVGAFDHVPTGAAADDSRVAFLGHLCTTTRLDLWEAGTGAPPVLTAGCAPPAIGRIEVGARTARVPLSCPAGSSGCAGILRVVAPRAGVPRSFALAAGERRTIPLLSRLDRRACVQLSLRRRWRLQLDLRGESVPTTTTALHRGRRVLCGAP